ncbi:hypothetical protein [Arthrobacter sp.]|uniref:hypothetical protein n=1 Tax=Arthrobacter sp. TaxID=1667 RepID=UPI003A9371C0
MIDRTRMGVTCSRIAATFAVALMVCGGFAEAAEADEGSAYGIRAQESKPGFAPEEMPVGNYNELQTLARPAAHQIRISDPGLQPPSSQSSGRAASTEGGPLGAVQDTDVGHRFWSPRLMALTILVGATLIVATCLFIRSLRAPKSTNGKRK